MALLVSGKWRRDQEMSIAFDEAPQAAPKEDAIDYPSEDINPDDIPF